MNEKTYPSDLTDEEWEWIKDLIPAATSGGRPRILCMRAVLNAIFSVTKGGIPWRMLPTNFPKWQSVYHYLRAWKLQGVWVRIHDTLRVRVREKEERHKHPTAGCLESQSVKTTAVGGADRGFDNGKKVKGRKRHVLVDTLGLLLIVVVSAASLSDQAGTRKIFQQRRGTCKKLRKVWVDGTYRGAERTSWVKAKYHGGVFRQTHTAFGVGDCVEHALLLPCGHGALARLLTMARREAELPGFFTQFKGHKQCRLGCVLMLIVGRCGCHGLCPPW
jgi:putative transposase